MAERTRGQTFTEAERLEYRDKVFSLRAQKLNNNQIALQLGIDNHTVQKLLEDAYREITIPKVEHALLEDLELIQQTIQIAAAEYRSTKNPRHADTVDKFLDKKFRLIGMYAPEKREVTVTEITQADIALSELVNEERARNSNVEADLLSLVDDD